jgi:hypothetical protein
VSRRFRADVAVPRAHAACLEAAVRNADSI